MAVGQNRCTTHFRTYFRGWIGMFTGGTICLLTHGHMEFGRPFGVGGGVGGCWCASPAAEAHRQVFTVPQQWSWPLDLPSVFYGIFSAGDLKAHRFCVFCSYLFVLFLCWPIRKPKEKKAPARPGVFAQGPGKRILHLRGVLFSLSFSLCKKAK